METQKVRVSDIEYNTQLGSRCCLLPQMGIDLYTNTEEDIYEALVNSESNDEYLSICKYNSRCKFFYQCFCNGETPSIEKDPIQLQEFGGKYWVREGKHRVCIAKRTKIEYVDACVEHLATDYKTLLPPFGTAGKWIVQAIYGRKVSGEIAILLVSPPNNSLKSLVLNSLPPLGKDKMEIFSGLSYRRSVSSSLFGGTSITVEVEIGENRPNTKIWFYTIPADGSRKIKTIFRCGRWRKIDLQSTIDFL